MRGVCVERDNRVMFYTTYQMIYVDYDTVDSDPSVYLYDGSESEWWQMVPFQPSRDDHQCDRGFRRQIMALPRVTMADRDSVCLCVNLASVCFALRVAAVRGVAMDIIVRVVDRRVVACV